MGVSPGVGSTIAGFFSDISRDEWVQLWAGLLGAVPAAILSAVVAALVAMFVLDRSNKNQQELAAEAVMVQRKLAAEQLREQRTEALRAREQAAIAEVIIAAEDFLEVTRWTQEDLLHRVRELKLAIARWRAELGVGKMQHEMLSWPPVLRQTAFALSASAHGDADTRKEVLSLLVNGIATITTAALAWQRSDAEERVLICEELAEERLEILASLKDLPASMRTS